MSHVYISSSTQDKAIADNVCAWLEKQGIRCWISPRDICPGVPWPEDITNAITTSSIMLIVFSAHTNESIPYKNAQA